MMRMEDKEIGWTWQQTSATAEIWDNGDSDNKDMGSHREE